MKTTKRTIRLVALVILVIALISSCISIFSRYYQQYTDDEIFKELAANTSVVGKEHANTPSKAVSDESESNIVTDGDGTLLEYQTLYQENKDLYGWLKISDTIIDYPVMYSPSDPQFYLYKNFYKEDSVSGTPFILVPSDTNTIVYGHNMKNKSMFSSLLKYKDVEFWNNHKYIEFNTLTQKGTYEIFIVSSEVVYYDESQIPKGSYLFYEHPDLSLKEDFDDYISELSKHQYFNSETSAKYGNSLLTLVTCDYVQENSRLVIVAKRVD